MKIIFIIVSIMLLLISATSASAHIDYKNVTINGSPWSNTFTSPSSWTGLNCWQVHFLSPGQNNLVTNFGDPTRSHYGIAVALDYEHWHGSAITGDFPNVNDDEETRQFRAGAQQLIVGTRRVWVNAGSYGTHKAIRFRHYNGVHTFVIRANC